MSSPHSDRIQFIGKQRQVACIAGIIGLTLSIAISAVIAPILGANAAIGVVVAPIIGAVFAAFAAATVQE